MVGPVQTALASDTLDRIGTALADPTRRLILLRLLSEPAYPADLADALSTTRPNVSNHLTCLRGCGLVRTTREGRQIRYELASEALAGALRLLIASSWRSSRHTPISTDVADMTDRSAATDQPTAVGQPGIDARPALVRRGRWLAWFTVGWNAIEGVAGIAAGVAAGSIALVGFGVDSYVEVLAGSIILWRLNRERQGEGASSAAEHRAVRLIALTFLALAVGVGVESIRKLAVGAEPDESLFGIGLAVVSLIVMPLLARAKRRVGEQLGSRAVTADATETTLCVWLSAILLVGLGANALFGWWWADPVAALGIVYIAAREGIEHLNADELNDCC